MKRNHKNKKELKEVQILKEENSKLRRQISKLRKVIAKLDMDRYEFVQDLIDSQKKQDKAVEKKIKKIENERKCHKCEEGVLQPFIVSRLDGMHYYRKCSDCSNRTKMKKLTEDVVLE